jgi:hypothetical protein
MDIDRLAVFTDSWFDLNDMRDWLERQAKRKDEWDENEQAATALLRLIEYIPNMLITEMRAILEKQVVLVEYSRSGD